MTSLEDMAARACEGRIPTDSQIRQIIELEPDRNSELVKLAHQVRTAHFGNRVSLCAIVNARSGKCSENCSFCAQSSHHHAHAPVYKMLDACEIGRAAENAAAHGARRFGIVASGKFVCREDLENFGAAVRAVAEAGLVPDVSPGILREDQFEFLKKNGLQGYHHNLETSRSFFPHMCTTHEYDEDVEAVKVAQKCGLYVCCGGIFGIGENWEHRVELALLLRELGVKSVPINFLTPIPGTPLENRSPLEPWEALRIVALFRMILPDSAIRLCGGRQTVFGSGHHDEPFVSGASGVMIGDYLTTRGEDVSRDMQALARLGLHP